MGMYKKLIFIFLAGAVALAVTGFSVFSWVFGVLYSEIACTMSSVITLPDKYGVTYDAGEDTGEIIMSAGAAYVEENISFQLGSQTVPFVSDGYRCGVYGRDLPGTEGGEAQETL